MALKVEAKGGKGGNEWDDGFDYEGVTEIHVRAGNEGIQFLKFEYLKGGKTIVGPIHGSESGRGLTEPFKIKPSEGECLVSVDGYYDESTGVIQSIEFKTNKKTSGLMGFNDGTKFSLRAIPGKMIVGFHGYADKNVHSLGAYFAKVFIKSELFGTQDWGYNDGVHKYDGIRKVTVGTHQQGGDIRYMKVDFDKAGKLESQERGNRSMPKHEFAVDYPKEYITSVEGTYAMSGYNCLVITSLTFKTSKARSSPVIGRATGTRFLLESPGNSIIGFYGRSGACIDSIGGFYGPAPTHATPSEKLQGQGGDGGDSWDDGAFQNVKKIYVGQGENGIAAVKFVYGKDAGEVVNEHGKVTLLGYESPFELYPDEYITSVEGCYDKIMGAETGIITMLKFKTNKRISEPYGLETTFKFVLEKEGHKITGFHGRASTVIHQIGVHVVPTTE